MPFAALHVRHQPRREGRVRTGLPWRSGPWRNSARSHRQEPVHRSPRECLMTNAAIHEIAQQDYKYGFVTDIESDVAPPGLSEDIIRFISLKKNEPEWMLERSEEHTSELQSQSNLVCRLLLEKKKKEHNNKQNTQN